MNLYFLLFYPIFVLFLTIFSLNILINFLNKKGILDMPQKRSNHSKPKPKCAGFIIVPIIIVSIFFFIYLDLIGSEPWEYICYITLVLFLMSFFRNPASRFGTPTIIPKWAQHGPPKRPRRLPERQNSTVNVFKLRFRHILERFWEPKSDPKWTQNS